MPQLICRDVSLGYNGHPISEHLNFEVQAGDYLCIVGENGSGKSTLIRTLLGLKAPLSGSIRLEEGLHSSDIGYLPQKTDLQRDFPATVEEIVISGCAGRSRFRPFYGKRERLDAITNMKIMDILPLAKRSFRDLSGGQQQRVLLARALCAANRILLLDEPVSGLDPHATEELYETIRHLNRHLGVTIIMVTHDLRGTMDDAKKILQMGKTPRFYPSPEQFWEETRRKGGLRRDYDPTDPV